MAGSAGSKSSSGKGSPTSSNFKVKKSRRRPICSDTSAAVNGLNPIGGSYGSTMGILDLEGRK